jgi:periplasmic nitrate reductase NapD
MKQAMTETSPTDRVDRRKFLNGQWSAGAVEAGDRFEIASILVQARPERLEAVARRIEGLPGVQIHGRDPKGKLVVVIEASGAGSIGATLNAISSMPDVLTSALVFQGSDGA